MVVMSHCTTKRFGFGLKKKTMVSLEALSWLKLLTIIIVMLTLITCKLILL